jgi:hypothetical protein
MASSRLLQGTSFLMLDWVCGLVLVSFLVAVERWDSSYYVGAFVFVMVCSLLLLPLFLAFYSVGVLNVLYQPVMSFGHVTVGIFEY